jgi:hypothetical protein
MGAVEVSAVPGLPTKRAGDIFNRCVMMSIYYMNIIYFIFIFIFALVCNDKFMNKSIYMYIDHFISNI